VGSLCFADHLFATLVYELQIHHAMHFRFSSFEWLDRAAFASSVARQPGVELQHFGAYPLNPLVASNRYSVVAVQDEVEAPTL